jgi:microcompartment protein CcmL/EutN
LSGAVTDEILGRIASINTAVKVGEVKALAAVFVVASWIVPPFTSTEAVTEIPSASESLLKTVYLKTIVLDPVPEK